MKQNEEADFWARTERNGECLDWKGGTAKGYGRFKWRGKTIRAHRLAFFFTHGRWPEDVLRHRCDRRCCVEPGHLLEGTQLDNVRDRVERDRSVRGERHHKAKLSRKDVEKAKELRDKGWSFAKIGEFFGVRKTAARRAILGITWRRE